MTAGAGIVHEEATLGTNEPLEGLQLWVGLPHAVRHSDPAFAHVGRPDVPVVPFESTLPRIVTTSPTFSWDSVPLPPLTL